MTRTSKSRSSTVAASCASAMAVNACFSSASVIESSIGCVAAPMLGRPGRTRNGPAGAEAV